MQGNHLWVASVGDSRALLLTTRTQQGGWVASAAGQIPALHGQPSSGSLYETEAALAAVPEADSRHSMRHRQADVGQRSALHTMDAQPDGLQLVQQPMQTISGSAIAGLQHSWSQQQLSDAGRSGLQLGAQLPALCSSAEPSEAADGGALPDVQLLIAHMLQWCTHDIPCALLKHGSCQPHCNYSCEAQIMHHTSCTAVICGC